MENVLIRGVHAANRLFGFDPVMGLEVASRRTWKWFEAQGGEGDRR